MKAIITGGTGLIGRALVSELRRLDWDVDCLSRHPPAVSEAGVTYHSADLRDPASLSAGVKRNRGASALFHLAAAMPSHDAAFSDGAYIQANTLSSLQLFQAALECGIERVVYASGVSVIGAPTQLPITEAHPVAPRSAYAISKLGGELFAEYLRETCGLRVTSLRISSPYGPGMSQASVLPRFAIAALHGKKVTWFGSGGRSQNFVHARDVARALVQAATSHAFGVYNIGGPESTSMQDLARLLVELTPDTGSSAGAAGSPDPQENERWVLSLTHTREELGYVPSVSLRDGLREYLDSLREGHGVRRDATP